MKVTFHEKIQILRTCALEAKKYQSIVKKVATHSLNYSTYCIYKIFSLIWPSKFPKKISQS